MRKEMTREDAFERCQHIQNQISELWQRQGYYAHNDSAYLQIGLDIDLFNEEFARCIDIAYPGETVTTAPTCQCGATKTLSAPPGSPLHSKWCPDA